MTLDPVIAKLLKITAALPRITEVPLAAARKGFLSRIAALPPATVALDEVRDIALPLESPARTLTLRLYRPVADGVKPRLLLYLHGGGFVLGNLDSHDAFCRRLCAASGFALLAVDYRLAPEHPWPAAHEDSWAALRWAERSAAELGVDLSTGISVAGDSAGGTLAAGLALRSRDEGGPVSAQALLYPALDHPDAGHASYVEMAEGYGLTHEAMRFFVEHYFAKPGDQQAPYALPIRATNLAGVAPALILTAEYDVLRDEGEAFAVALKSAGVAVELKRYEGMNHGFLALAQMVAGADEGIAHIARWLRELP